MGARIGAAQPGVSGLDRVDGGRGRTGLAGRGQRAADGLRRSVHLRHRRLAGVAVSARIRARADRLAIRRPRRRGARVPDPGSAALQPSRAVATAADHRYRAGRDWLAGRRGVPADLVHESTTPHPGQPGGAGGQPGARGAAADADPVALRPGPFGAVVGGGLPGIPPNHGGIAQSAARPGPGRIRRPGTTFESRDTARAGAGQAIRLFHPAVRAPGGQPVDLRDCAVVLRVLRCAGGAGELGQLADPVLEPLVLTLAIYALVRIYYWSWAPATVTPRPRPIRLG